MNLRQNIAAGRQVEFDDLPDSFAGGLRIWKGAEGQ
jgi:hypothetical protein